MARKAKKDLVWNVFIGDFNRRQISHYNIFNHYSFRNDLKKIAKKYKEDRAAFEEEVRRDLQYYFWSKCEWEIILDGWPSRDDFRQEKIDVYDQVRLNWEQFTNYLWENRSSV